MKTKTTSILNLRRGSDGEVFEAKLMTRIKRLAYDIETRTGYLDCGPNDMRGTIELFNAIDPEVREIISNDMVYRRCADGTWDALRFRPERWEEQRITLNGIEA